MKINVKELTGFSEDPLWDCIATSITPNFDFENGKRALQERNVSRKIVNTLSSNTYKGRQFRAIFPTKHCRLLDLDALRKNRSVEHMMRILTNSILVPGCNRMRQVKA